MANRERNFHNFHRDIRKLNNHQKPAKNGKNGHVIHSPQDSSLSSSFNSLSSKEVKMNLSPVENCGNVDKRGPAFFSRRSCGRQVYSSLEVARGMVISLAAIGISAAVEQCGTCRLIHVLERQP